MKSLPDLREDLLRIASECSLTTFSAADLLTLFRARMAIDLPYRSFGYKSGEDFIRAIPDFLLVSSPSGVRFELTGKKSSRKRKHDDERKDGKKKRKEGDSDPLKRPEPEERLPNVADVSLEDLSLLMVVIRSVENLRHLRRDHATLDEINDIGQELYGFSYSSLGPRIRSYVEISSRYPIKVELDDSGEVFVDLQYGQKHRERDVFAEQVRLEWDKRLEMLRERVLTLLPEFGRRNVWQIEEAYRGQFRNCTDDYTEEILSLAATGDRWRRAGESRRLFCEAVQGDDRFTAKIVFGGGVPKNLYLRRATKEDGDSEKTRVFKQHAKLPEKLSLLQLEQKKAVGRLIDLLDRKGGFAPMDELETMHKMIYGREVSAEDKEVWRKPSDYLAKVKVTREGTMDLFEYRSFRRRDYEALTNFLKKVRAEYDERLRVTRDRFLKVMAPHRRLDLEELAISYRRRFVGPPLKTEDLYRYAEASDEETFLRRIEGDDIHKAEIIYHRDDEGYVTLARASPKLIKKTYASMGIDSEARSRFREHGLIRNDFVDRRSDSVDQMNSSDSEEDSDVENDGKGADRVAESDSDMETDGNGSISSADDSHRRDSDGGSEKELDLERLDSESDESDDDGGSESPNSDFEAFVDDCTAEENRNSDLSETAGDAAEAVVPNNSEKNPFPIEKMFIDSKVLPDLYPNSLSDSDCSYDDEEDVSEAESNISEYSFSGKEGIEGVALKGYAHPKKGPWKRLTNKYSYDIDPKTLTYGELYLLLMVERVVDLIDDEIYLGFAKEKDCRDNYFSSGYKYPFLLPSWDWFLKGCGGCPNAIQKVYDEPLTLRYCDYACAPSHLHRAEKEDQKRLKAARKRIAQFLSEVESIPLKELSQRYREKYGVELDKKERERLVGVESAELFCRRLAGSHKEDSEIRYIGGIGCEMRLARVTTAEERKRISDQFLDLPAVCVLPISELALQLKKQRDNEEIRGYARGVAAEYERRLKILREQILHVLPHFSFTVEDLFLMYKNRFEREAETFGMDDFLKLAGCESPEAFCSVIAGRDRFLTKIVFEGEKEGKLWIRRTLISDSYPKHIRNFLLNSPLPQKLTLVELERIKEVDRLVGLLDRCGGKADLKELEKLYKVAYGRDLSGDARNEFWNYDLRKYPFKITVSRRRTFFRNHDFKPLVEGRKYVEIENRMLAVREEFSKRLKDLRAKILDVLDGFGPLNLEQLAEKFTERHGGEKLEKPDLFLLAGAKDEETFLRRVEGDDIHTAKIIYYKDEGVAILARASQELIERSYANLGIDSETRREFEKDEEVREKLAKIKPVIWYPLKMRKGYEFERSPSPPRAESPELVDKWGWETPMREEEGSNSEDSYDGGIDEEEDVNLEQPKGEKGEIDDASSEFENEQLVMEADSMDVDTDGTSDDMEDHRNGDSKRSSNLVAEGLVGQKKANEQVETNSDGADDDSGEEETRGVMRHGVYYDSGRRGADAAEMEASGDLEEAMVEETAPEYEFTLSGVKKNSDEPIPMEEDDSDRLSRKVEEKDLDGENGGTGASDVTQTAVAKETTNNDEAPDEERSHHISQGLSSSPVPIGGSLRNNDGHSFSTPVTSTPKKAHVYSTPSISAILLEKADGGETSGETTTSAPENTNSGVQTAATDTPTTSGIPTSSTAATASGREIDDKFKIIGDLVSFGLQKAANRGEDATAIAYRVLGALYGN